MTEAERAVTDYTIIIEVAGKNFSAYAPDVPGCVAAGDTIEETHRLMHEALNLHVDMLREMGEPIPAPRTQAAVVQIAR